MQILPSPYHTEEQCVSTTNTETLTFFMEVIAIYRKEHIDDAREYTDCMGEM
jgi:hypothetical protein